MSKVLLHLCCAPCTTYVNKWLQQNGFEVEGYFYNPNIRPESEYVKRKETVAEYADKTGLEVFYEEIDLLTGLPACPARSQGQVRPEIGNCEECLRLRLLKTVQFASENSFPSFTTTLLVSPYQKHDFIKQTGEELGSEFEVAFVYQDFRVGYQESVQISKEMKLYRQKYCGCGKELEVRREKIYAKVS